jgi:hypothetical protein
MGGADYGGGMWECLPRAKGRSVSATLLLTRQRARWITTKFKQLYVLARPARFGVQLVFLDSDVRHSLLLPDHASVAPGNFGGVDLEHVARRALKANRSGGRSDCMRRRNHHGANALQAIC